MPTSFILDTIRSQACLQSNLAPEPMNVWGYLKEHGWGGVIEKLRAGISDNSPKVHFHLSSNSIILPLHLTLVLSMQWEQENGGWTLCWGAHDSCATILYNRPDHVILGECLAGRLQALLWFQVAVVTSCLEEGFCSINHFLAAVSYHHLSKQFNMIFPGTMLTHLVFFCWWCWWWFACLFVFLLFWVFVCFVLGALSIFLYSVLGLSLLISHCWQSLFY